MGLQFRLCDQAAFSLTVRAWSFILQVGCEKVKLLVVNRIATALAASFSMLEFADGGYRFGWMRGESSPPRVFYCKGWSLFTHSRRFSRAESLSELGLGAVSSSKLNLQASVSDSGLRCKPVAGVGSDFSG